MRSCTWRGVYDCLNPSPSPRCHAQGSEGVAKKDPKEVPAEDTGWPAFLQRGVSFFFLRVTYYKEALAKIRESARPQMSKERRRKRRWPVREASCSFPQPMPQKECPDIVQQSDAGHFCSALAPGRQPLHSSCGGGTQARFAHNVCWASDSTARQLQVGVLRWTVAGASHDKTLKGTAAKIYHSAICRTAHVTELCAGAMMTSRLLGKMFVNLQYHTARFTSRQVASHQTENRWSPSQQTFMLTAHQKQQMSWHRADRAPRNGAVQPLREGELLTVKCNIQAGTLCCFHVRPRMAVRWCL